MPGQNAPREDTNGRISCPLPMCGRRHTHTHAHTLPPSFPSALPQCKLNVNLPTQMPTCMPGQNAPREDTNGRISFPLPMCGRRHTPLPQRHTHAHTRTRTHSHTHTLPHTPPTCMPGQKTPRDETNGRISLPLSMCGRRHTPLPHSAHTRTHAHTHTPTHTHTLPHTPPTCMPGQNAPRDETNGRISLPLSMWTSPRKE
jgi:hypothetical protein